MLAEARSEIMKQECKVVSLTTCTRELQRQAHSRLELDEANCGNEESWRKHVRFEEELALGERALRNTRNRNIHEKDELRRVQEMRADEFSIQKLRERHATIQELTSQIQDLQKRTNCMNYWREFEEKNRFAVENYLSQPAVVPSPRSMLSRDRSMPPDTWSNHYSSINRAWLRPAILRKASRHALRTRPWTMTRFVLCWLPHCTTRSERQMRNDRKFITLYETTWCPVHLRIR